VDEICSRGPKVCHDCWIWRRSVGVNSLTPSVLDLLEKFGILRKGEGSSEVPEPEVNLGCIYEDAR
jgi:hypothetical protein